jgi:ABC-type nitrate/sulfonate/bicarbonate transport system permease component
MARYRSVLPVLAFLALWEAGSRVLDERAPLLPPPSICVRALLAWLRSGELFQDLGASLLRLSAGLVVGVILGAVVGLATGRIRWLSEVLTPIVNMWRALPPISLLPLVTLLAGVGDGARIFVIAFGAFFPVWVAAHAGASEIPEQLLWAARTLTTSRVRIATQVILPATAPYLVAGTRLAIGTGYTLVFVSELLGATHGLGYRVSIATLAYRSDLMLAALFVLGATAAATDWAFRRFAQSLLPWLAIASTAGRPRGVS